MTDVRTQQVSLVGQVVEDVTFVPFHRTAFTASLIGVTQSPLYKEGGFFVFVNVKPGHYTLRVAAERFQAQEIPITIPLQPSASISPPFVGTMPLFSLPGDNELAVSVNAINTTTRKISFDPVVLTRPIGTGAAVEAAGFHTTLDSPVDVGRVSDAKVASVDGLLTGQIVRIIRDQSIRLNFDPYYLFPEPVTRIVGRVVRRDALQIPIGGARVELTGINGGNVVLNAVGDAQIATVTLAGVTTVLGSDRDVTTLTNQNGDYHFYFSRAAVAGSITVVASRSGFQPQVATGFAVGNQRQRLDVQLTPL